MMNGFQKETVSKDPWLYHLRFDFWLFASDLEMEIDRRMFLFELVNSVLLITDNVAVTMTWHFSIFSISKWDCFLCDDTLFHSTCRATELDRMRCDAINKDTCFEIQDFFVGDEATPFTTIVSRENKNYRQVDLPIIFDRLRSVVVVVVGKDIGILCRERLFMFSCVFIRSLHRCRKCASIMISCSP